MSKFFIISALEVVGLLRRLTNEYVVSFDNELVNAALGFDRSVKVDESKKTYYVMSESIAHEIATAILTDVLESKMLWLRRTNHNNHCVDALARNIPGFSFSESSAHLAQSNHFFTKVIDEVMLGCEKLVSMQIPDPTWTIWSIYVFGKDFILEQGSDYRIVDWTRRMNNGEWSKDNQNDFLDGNVQEINQITADIISQDSGVKQALAEFLTSQRPQRGVLSNVR